MAAWRRERAAGRRRWRARTWAAAAKERGSWRQREWRREKTKKPRARRGLLRMRRRM